MASFFKDVGKKIGEASQAVKSKTEELAAVSKLHKAINEENKKIEDSTTQMGQKMFDMFKAGDTIPEELNEQCNVITESQKAIIKLNEELKVVKGIKDCTKCGAELDIEVRFCPSCGAEQEVPEKPAEEKAANAETKACPTCGAELPLDAGFCTGCGAKL